MTHPSDTVILAWRRCDDAALLRQCILESFRGPGPGGQKRNKTSSAVRLRHTPTGLAGEADESRSQAVNRAAAMLRLRWQMALHLRAWDETTPPTVARYVRSGRLLSPARTDRVGFYAELLDVLSSTGWAVAEAADFLGITTGNFVRLLQDEPQALRWVNTQRQTKGLKPLGG